MSLEEKMRGFVKKVSLPLEVVHLPDPKNSRHGEIKGDAILIYDSDEEAAWTTLLHEITEYRLKPLIAPYRRLVNKLIEALEAEVYLQKERVLNEVVNDMKVWRNLEAERLAS